MYFPIPKHITAIFLVTSFFRQSHGEEIGNPDDDQIKQALEIARLLLNGQKNPESATYMNTVDKLLNEDLDIETPPRYLSTSLPANPRFDPNSERLNLDGVSQLIEHEKKIYPYREARPDSNQYPIDRTNFYTPKKPLYQYEDPRSKQAMLQSLRSGIPSYYQQYQNGGIYRSLSPYMDSMYPRVSQVKPKALSNEQISSSRLLQTISTLQQEVRRFRLNNRLAKQTVEDLQKATRDVQELKALVKQITLKDNSPYKPLTKTPKSLKTAQAPKKAPKLATLPNLVNHYHTQGMKDIDTYSPMWGTTQPSNQILKVNTTSLPIELRNSVNITNLKPTPDGYLIGGGFAYKDGYWYNDGYWYKNGYYWENGKWYNGELEIIPQTNCNTTLPCILGNPPPVPSLMQ